ncbi:hypothetical protein POTOM_008970 [Populus tomentosa]|uniref:Uncharacterized protein n=1 Tax=Populus tomentosa TaxID=118781 RepID=A0A8X8AIB7_POPTO|nr:hypothetical protein POTOM_008970 [Populus tomentosa]
MKAPQLDYNKYAADFSRAGKPDILEELAQKMKFSGKFEVCNVFARWAEMMKKRVKRREPMPLIGPVFIVLLLRCQSFDKFIAGLHQPCLHALTQ